MFWHRIVPRAIKYQTGFLKDAFINGGERRENGTNDHDDTRTANDGLRA